MNRRELAKNLQNRIQFENDEGKQEPFFSSFMLADDTLKLIFQIIGNELQGGGEVAIAGFGRWKVRQTAAGLRRNPQTQAMVRVAASQKVRFYPSTALKAAVAGKSPARRRPSKRA
ncbi:MAG TPA: HU family DNA-binding protein [Candidatus Dormibacteraeota bacterium]|nr:HU family DNA-binding protein [Candidatus Dormibacteraeota bacterium]